MRSRGSGVVLLVAAVCVIAGNMRTSITGVGPLLQEISGDLDVSVATLGALASVPLLTWAAVSPLTHHLSHRFGMSRTVLWALVVLGIGTIWRSFPGPAANLWVGTAIIGCALAVTNVLMPAVIKRDFPGRVPLMMGVYTALLGGIGSVSSGVVVPLSNAAPDGVDGWRFALGLTAALLPLAIALWSWVMAAGLTHDERLAEVAVVAGAGRRNIWRDKVAWLVAAYMGLQSINFYIMLTWIAPFALSHGHSPIQSGIDTMVYQMTGLFGSLVVPIVLRGSLGKHVAPALPAITFVAVCGLLLAPGLLTVWAVVAGFTAGGMLGMALTLMAERAGDAKTSAALSGMAQCVGYLFAATGPVAFGWLHDITGAWTLSFVTVLVLLIVTIVVGVLVSRPRYVFEN